MATPDVLQGQEEERVQKHHERLAAIAAGGQAWQYGLVVRGKAFTADRIDALDNTEIEKMYARYEARLGVVMTKMLGSAALQLYAGVASMFLPIPAENQPGLIADLEGDPFVGHVLSSATCELHHRYGMFLAPLTSVLTTVKHCHFEHQCRVRINDGRDVAKQQGEPRDVAKQAEKPAQSPVERVTDPRQKVKDLRKVAAGHAGAAARKAKQEIRLLEQLRSAKESFRPPAGDGTSANIPLKEADQEQAVSADKRPEHPEELTNWTPWIIGACLTGGVLMFLPRLHATQMPQAAQTSGGTGASPIDTAPKQLEASPNPFYME